MDVVVNWLWQGCAVALAAVSVLHLLPRLSATTRYRGWWVALVLIVALPAIPGIVELLPAEPVVSSATVAQTLMPSSPLAVTMPLLPWWLAALLMAVWSTWVAVSLLRLAGALVALRRSKSSATPFPPHREAQLARWLSIRSTGRRAALVVSEDVRSAAVLGLRAPVIAVAPALLRDLSDAELDQILVHEWAHVQRRDDIGGLCQWVVTAVAGLHPAVWWINRRLHIERETACDDWTVNITGAPKGYAACLTKLAALGNDSALVPAAWSSSTLRTRVMRLLDRRRNTSTRFTVATLAIAPALAVVAVGAASVELVVTRPPVAIHELANQGRSVVGSRQDALIKVAGTFAEKVPATFHPAADKPAQVPGTLASDPGPAGKVAGTFPAKVPATSDQRQTATPTREVRVPETAVPLPTVEASALEVATLPGSTEPVPTLGDVAKTATSPAAAAPPTPWGAAADAGIAVADAGVAVGRGSKKGAVATAGFFTRMSKAIAGAF
jgi:bla regulator protein blaR1